MAKTRKLRSMIALGIIILLGLAGAGFITLKLLHRPSAQARAYNQAVLLLKGNRYEEACAQAQKALGDTNWDFPARQLIAQARKPLKQFDEAEKVIQDGLTDQRRKQYEDGLSILQAEMAKLGPKDDRPAKEKAIDEQLKASHPGYREYMQLQITLAGVKLSEMQSLVASHPDELTLTAEVQGKSDVRRNIEVLTHQIDTIITPLQSEHPEDAQIYQLLGDFFEQRRQFVHASAAAYAKEERQFRLMDKPLEAASAQRRAGDILNELPRLVPKALMAYQNAVRCNPDNAQSRLNLATLMLYGTNPNYDEALNEVEEVIKRADRVPAGQVLQARILRADLMSRTGHRDEAITDMGALLQAKPKTNMAAVEYINLLLDRAETADEPGVRQTSLVEARRVIDELEKQTRNTEVVFLKSRASLAMNQPAEAISNLSQIIDNLVPLEQELPFVARAYYYLGKAQLFDVEQARHLAEQSDRDLKKAQEAGVPENIAKAIKDQQTANDNYHSLAMGAKSGMDSLNEAVTRIRMVRDYLAPDERKRMDALLIDAQTTIVYTMMARGDLGDVSDRMVQALSIELDNDLAYQLLAKSIEKEKDPDKSRRLTLQAAKLRLLSGNYDAAMIEAEKGISLFGVSPEEAAQATKASSKEELAKVQYRIAVAEQLHGVAGLAALLQEKTDQGMAHFLRAAELHNVYASDQRLTADIYAQQQYSLLTMVQFRRGLIPEAERTLGLAMKQFPNSADLYELRASMAGTQRRLGTAIEAMKSAIALAPKRGDLYITLAGLYLEMGMNDQAKAEIALMPSDVTRSYPLLVQLGQAYSRLGDHDTLRKIIGELLTKYGSEPVGGLRVRLIAASFCLDCGDYVQAAKLASDIPATVQIPPELNVQRAIIYLRTGDLQKVAETLEEVMKTRPDDRSFSTLGTFFTLGMTYLEMDRHPGGAEETKRKTVDAQTLVKKIAKDYPEFGHARLLEAVALFQSDKTAAALETLKAPFTAARDAVFNGDTRDRLQPLLLVAQDQLDAALAIVHTPANFPSELAKQYESATRDMLTGISRLPADKRQLALKALARYYLAQRGQLWLFAIADSQELALLLPNDPLVALNLASAYGSANESSKARKVLEEMLKSHPDFAEGWRVLGLLCRRDNDLEGAETAFKKFLALVNDAPSVTVLLAQVLESAGKSEQAVPLYESVVSKSDRFPDALNNLAYHLITGANPDIERGIAYAKRAVESAPSNGGYLDTLGWAYYLQGTIDPAIENLEKGVQFNPVEPVIRYHLAMAYLKQASLPEDQRKKKATDSFREALAISPAFSGADSARNELQKLGS